MGSNYKRQTMGSMTLVLLPTRTGIDIKLAWQNNPTNNTPASGRDALSTQEITVYVPKDTGGYTWANEIS
jgi:hypothetical protein